MQSNHRTLIAALFIGLGCFPAGAATNEAPLSHRVTYEIGDREFAPGDSISIEEIRGTAATFANGETYSVSGRYTLASADEADLSLFSTTTDPTPRPTEPRQTVRVKKGSGTFSVMKTITENGYLHLTFYPVSGGAGFGGVYFGQGPWVLHDKHFSYRNQSKPTNDSAPAAATATRNKSVKVPNQVLFEYLGSPVTAPADMDPAYSRESLMRAIFAAAAKAGLPIKSAHIDDSEFPFLLGLVYGPGELNKLKDEVNKISAYEWSGGVSSETCMAINIVPHRAFPSASAQQIYRRLMLREAVLFDRIKER